MDSRFEKVIVLNCISRLSNRNQFDLVERDLIAGAIIERRCAQALMRGHELRVFKRTAILKICRDVGRTESVLTDTDFNAELGRAACAAHG